MFMFIFVVFLLAVIGVVVVFALRILIPLMGVAWKKAGDLGRHLAGNPSVPPACRFCGRRQS